MVFRKKDEESAKKRLSDAQKGGDKDRIFMAKKLLKRVQKDTQEKDQ